MGFEDYQVTLYPRDDVESKIKSFDTSLDIARELVGAFPSVSYDPKHSAGIVREYENDSTYLVHVSPLGLIQIEITVKTDIQYISLRFAYCNPQTVLEPFFELIRWIMARYGTVCVPMRNLDEDLNGPSINLLNADELESTITPSVEMHKRLWHTDIGDHTEMIVSPGDALYHYFKHLIDGNR